MDSPTSSSLLLYHKYSDCFSSSCQHKEQDGDREKRARTSRESGHVPLRPHCVPSETHVGALMNIILSIIYLHHQYLICCSNYHITSLFLAV